VPPKTQGGERQNEKEWAEWARHPTHPTAPTAATQPRRMSAVAASVWRPMVRRDPGDWRRSKCGWPWYNPADSSLVSAR
jgi:hypothetical protein